MTPAVIYSLAGAALFSLGLGGLFFCRHFFQKILAMNFAGSGGFLVVVAFSRRQSELPPDPVPQALVLTGIVVAVSATAVMLTLYRRLVTSREPTTAPERPKG